MTKSQNGKYITLFWNKKRIITKILSKMEVIEIKKNRIINKWKYQK
jgi:hypothetical protein